MLLKNFYNYGIKSFQKDLYAGLIVGIISIPLGMAFAIASGVKPEYGIYTTILAGIFISILGGSKFQISGPTGAFIPVLLVIVIDYGYQNLLIAGFMAGIILLLMGLFKLGSLIKYMPLPVTIGFTSGIAVLIFVGQVPNFLGLSDIEKHESFFLNLIEIFKNINQINPYSLLIASLGLATILLTPKLTKKIPGAIIGLIVSSIISYLFFEDFIITIGSAYGSIPNSLPGIHMLDFSLENIKVLLVPAFTIAMLGSIESLLSAVVADGMTGDKHDSNRELIGQGIGNMIIPFFGGIPATGAIARTATNIKSGAISKVSAIVHSLTVLLVLILFAPFASHIPLASIAPVLMIVAWNMSERKQFAHILRTKFGDALILLTTFLLTVFVNLAIAIGVGLMFAIIIFAKRMSELITISKVLPDHNIKNDKLTTHMVYEGHDCPQISIYTIEGPLFFGIASMFTKTMKLINYKPKILLLRMRHVPFIDTTGESNLRDTVINFKNSNGIVLISGIKEHPKDVLKKSGMYNLIGEDNFFEDTEKAIKYAFTIIDQDKCKDCKYYAFKECKKFNIENTVDTADESKKII